MEFQNIDFALTFWMVHEILRSKEFFEQIFSILKRTGKYLLVEPKVHVSHARFGETIKNSMQKGFKMMDNPHISLSRAALFGKL